MTGVFDTDFRRPPAFTPEQREALLKGEAVGVNGVHFSLANLTQGDTPRLYGPPAAPGANSFAAYKACPDAWKAAAAEAGKILGKQPGELEQELDYDLFDELVSIVQQGDNS